MKNKKDHISNSLSPEDIEKYLKGELTHEQMHAVEKLMLDSEFDAEAMEGFEQNDAEQLSHDLAQLQNRLDDRIASKNKFFPIWLKIAASLTLLIVSTFIILKIDFNKNSPEFAQSAENITTEQSKKPEVDENESDAVDDLLALNDAPITVEEKEATATKSNSGPIRQDKKPKKVQEIETNDQKLKESISITEEAEPLSLMEIELDENADLEEIVYERIAMANDGDLNLKDKVAGVEVEKPREITKKRDRSKSEVSARAAAADYSPNIQKTITGKITSAKDGSSLPGVNVVLKGTNEGTVADIDGNFQITIPEDMDPTLVVSFIGLTTEELEIGSRTFLDIQLHPDVTQLSEVVVSYEVEQEEYSPDVMVKPTPVEGNKDFKEYIEDNLIHPNDTVKLSGRVVVEFDVMPNGNLANFNIIKSLHPTYDQEAIRVIKEGPEWSPGTRNGIPEKITMKVRIKF